MADPQAKLSAQAALLARAMDRTLVWDNLRWLRSIWKGPLLLKGLLRPADGGRFVFVVKSDGRRTSTGVVVV